MPRIALDTVGSNYAAVAAIRCLKLGYVNGPQSAWTKTQIDEQHRRGELLGLIDVLGDAPDQASIIDWERFDVQDPARLRWWVETRNAFRGDAVAYSNRDSLPGLLGAMTGSQEYYQLIVADLTPTGQPPLAPPDFGLPPNVRLLGVQYAWSDKSGGPFNLDILYNDAWHATHSPVHLAAPAEAVPAEVEAPKTPAGVTSYAPPLTSSSLSAPFASLSASPLPAPEVVIGQAAAATPATPATPADEPPVALVRPFVGAHAAIQDASAADFTAAPAAGPGPIDHARVWAWIQDGKDIAARFRGAGAGQLAGVLEDALTGVLEVGRLLSAAGG